MNIYAQGGNTFKDIKKYLKEKPKFTGYLDGRNSFAEATRNNIFGAFIGASFANRIDLGLAYYQTVNEPPVLNLRNEGTPSQDSFVSFTKYNYFALRFSYMFHKSKKWEILYQILSENKIQIFYGEDTDYFDKINQWVYL